MASNQFMGPNPLLAYPQGDPLSQLGNQITGVESGGRADAKNPRSSATGTGQFINRTWLDMVKRHRPDLMEGRTKAEILELRKVKELSDKMTELYAQENQKTLSDAGLPVTPGTTYLAHFAGSGGAKAVLQNPEASAAEVMAAAGNTTSDKILKANPFLQGMTGSDLTLWADKKMNKTGKKSPAAMPEVATVSLSPDDPSLLPQSPLMAQQTITKSPINTNTIPEGNPPSDWENQVEDALGRHSSDIPKTSKPLQFASSTPMSINDASDEDLERMLLGESPSSTKPTSPLKPTTPAIKSNLNIPNWALPKRLQNSSPVAAPLQPGELSDEELEKVLLGGDPSPNTEQKNENSPTSNKSSPELPVDEKRKEVRQTITDVMANTGPAGGILKLLSLGRFDDKDDSWKGHKNSGRKPQDLVTGKERDSWGNWAGQLGVGAMRGGANVLDTAEGALGGGVNYLASKIAPQSVADAINAEVTDRSNEMTNSRNATEREYGDRTMFSVGKVAGEVAATSPLLAYGPLAQVGARAGSLVPAALGGITRRVVSGAAGGAAGGAALNMANSSASDKPFLQHVAEGATGGAIGGAALSAAGATAGKIANKILSPSDPMTRQLAQRAEELGINLRPSQVSSSQTFKKFDQMSGQLPLAGASKTAAKQQSEFNRAVGRTFGEESEAITPDVIERARERLGGEFEKIGKASTIKVDQKFADHLKDTLQEAKDHLVESEFGPVAAKVNDIIKMAKGTGTITGDQYQALVKKNAPLWRAMHSPDPNIKYYANRIRDGLDDALERSTPKELVESLKETKRQWKAMKTVESLADKGVGDISPQLLMSKVIQSPGGKRGGGTLAELADIGKKFLKEQKDSGTPQGLTFMNALTHPLTAIGTAAAGAAGKLPYAAEGGMFLGANRLMREGLLNRDYLKRAILNRGQSTSNGNKLTPTVGGVAGALINTNH